MKHVGDGRRFGMDVQLVFDGETPLGTGGAVHKRLTQLDGPFFVLYGDSYLPCDYADIQAFLTIKHNPVYDALSQLGQMGYQQRGNG